jgi:prepilin-type processing-associated H-X9-DG protein/prepilin-type N-terminal cleavage/methylation domain-containing protein
MRDRLGGSEWRAFTLIELLCTIAMLALLMALMLPAIEKGKAKAQLLRCVSNLRQTGLAFLYFAHAHEDRFPTQVSTNQGGSAEFLEAASSINGEFYFSYRHFVPLAADLQTPKILLCPADQRPAATNFESFRNTNLSYFIGARPEAGKTDSVLAGDRNLTPSYGSIAKVGGFLYLKWTEELHRYKGNVLFADGHVEQLKDVFSLSNSLGGPTTSLLMPSVKSDAPASSGASAGIGGPAGNPAPRTLTLAAPAGNKGPALTNRMLTNFVVTSTAISASPAVRYSGVPGGDEVTPLARAAAPAEKKSPAARPLPAPAAAEQAQASTPAPAAVERQPSPFDQLMRWVSSIPWWVILLLLLVLVEVRRRLRAARLRAQRSRPVLTVQPILFDKQEYTTHSRED